jgi:hypothetical protein
LVARSLRERKLDAMLVRFFVGTAATAALAAGYAVWRLHGVGIFADWAAKMALHVDSHASWNVGFRTIFNTALDMGAGADLGAVDTHLSRLETGMLWGSRLAVLVPALYFTRFMTPASAYGFCYVVMFYAVAPVHYYAMVLCLPLLYWVAEPASWSRTVGLAWLLLTGALGYLLYYGWTPLHRVPLFEGYGLGFANTLVMTWFITLGTLHMIGHAAGKARAYHPPYAAAASAPA